MIHLSYHSTSLVDDGSSTFFVEIARILERSLTNNIRLQVTGILAYGDGRFVQVLEGPAANVEWLYQRIAADVRHSAPVILMRRTIDTRAFGSWSMAYVGRGGVGSAMSLLGRNLSPAAYDAAIATLTRSIG